MASEGQRITIGEVAKIKHGFAFKGEFFTDDVQPTVLVTPGNFAIGGGFQLGKTKFYAGPIPSDYVLATNDLVVTMTDLSKASDTLGFAAKVPETPGVRYLHNQRVGLVQMIDETRVRKDWLHYLMRTDQYRAWVIGSASGTTVKHTSPSRIESYAFIAPAVDHQEASAQLLDAFEARIDNLRQTNATLEAIAKALFKSWFVDFDPVRAKAEGREPDGMDAATAAMFPNEFEDSELGPIPRGWRVDGLGKCCDNIRKQAKPESLESSTPYIGLEHMPRKSIALTDWDSVDGLASGKFWYQSGDVLFGKLRPYFHKVGVASHEGVCSTDILVVRASSPAWFGFAAMHLSSDALVSYATQLSNGAKMPRTNWHDLAAYKVATPNEACASAFSEVVEPMIERIHSGIDTIRSLAELRDTLLPRLISGKLRLPEVAEKIETET